MICHSHILSGCGKYGADGNKAQVSIYVRMVAIGPSLEENSEAKNICARSNINSTSATGHSNWTPSAS